MKNHVIMESQEYTPYELVKIKESKNDVKDEIMHKTLQA